MMLPIRQNINKLAGLNRTQAAILIEVCELTENGTHGGCTAKNDRFTQRLNATARTVTRTLAELERVGLIAISGATKLRIIKPTATCRACYTGTEAENFSAVITLGNTLSIDKKSKMSIDKEGLSIDIQCKCLQTNNALSIDNQCTLYKHTSSNEQKDEQYSILTSRIAELEAEVQSANAACAAKQIEVDYLLTENKKLLEDSGVEKVALAGLLLAKSGEAIKTIWESLPQPPIRGTELSNAFYQHKFAKKKIRAADPVVQIANQNRQTIIDTHFQWFKARNKNMTPVVNEMEAKSALVIFKYFRGQEGAQTDQDAHDAFAMLLANWHVLDGFSQKRQTLNNISSTITNLIAQLIQHGQPIATQQSARAKELGLSDHTQRHAAAEYLKSIGLE